jgi:uncharacterized ubiquitin-like protein YukD
VITLQSRHWPESKDLELSGKVPLKRLLPELRGALNLPPGKYQLARQSRVLLEDETLFDAHILTGDILELLSDQDAPSQADDALRTRPYALSATLTTANGHIIALDNFGLDELLIGRNTSPTSQLAHIDLGDEPDGDTVSRPHAQLRREGDQWIILPLKTHNPTRVEDEIVPSGQSRLLKSGDIICLGGARLEFKQEG